MVKWTVSLAVKEMIALGMPGIEKVTEDTLMKHAKKIRAERRKQGLPGKIVVEKKAKPKRKVVGEIHHLPPEKKTAKLWRKFTRKIAEEEHLEPKDVREHLPLKGFTSVPDSSMREEVQKAWQEWKTLSEN